MTRRAGVLTVELAVALPLAALVLGAAWFAFHTGARQGAAVAAATDLLVLQVRVRAPLEADLGSLVTDGTVPSCALSTDGRRLELRTLAAVPADPAAALPVRRVVWEAVPARPSGWHLVRDGRVLSPRSLREVRLSVSRRERRLTVRAHLTDANGRTVEVAAVHQAAISLPGLVEVLADPSVR